ncbi:alpha-amylase family glycosyl hydrolase [Ferrimonas gelatinilytica]|uniref:Alpha-amylase n=1 Tax=Ferrimonas gelatinilytica TaxID=1255257 RepID=A0ABP9RTP3_9GAMM
MKPTLSALCVLASLISLAGCGTSPQAGLPPAQSPDAERARYIGTEHPFASEAVYFVVTDRFVDGDPGNNYPEESGWDRPLRWENGDTANVGYLGGDWQGILNNTDYIREMGFTSVWITPIVENPSEAFNGGTPITQGSIGTDRGKSGYHGYWGVNFYREDKHWGSQGLNFRQFTAAMREQGLGTVLDIVLNHGSPAYSMDPPQPLFGQLYDGQGDLVADHQNLAPQALDPEHNPLHAFFRNQPDLAQLADMDERKPEVMDYFVGAYLQWIEQGASAFRIDTVKHIDAASWGTFAARIREQHPEFFMFGEVYDYSAEGIAPYTYEPFGGMSVLDFPMKAALGEVFEQGRGFDTLLPTLKLEQRLYANPYELTTFYDNHDMPRLNADDNGFIDAHNWLFTARGIPVVYYGSEMGFMRGKAEHSGNRNYFGQERVEQARTHPIRQQLMAIARVRQATPALQRGVQLNLSFEQDTAAFYRVLQDGEQAQTALVLLNKGDEPAAFTVREYLQAGGWQEQLGGEWVTIEPGTVLETQVPAHGVKVFVRNGTVEGAALNAELARLMALRDGILVSGER